MEVDTQAIGKLEGAVKSLVSSIDKLDRMMFGNGNEGIMQRTTRNEENIEITIERQKENTVSIGELAKLISDLQKIVEVHIKDEEVHSYKVLLKKNIITYILIAFLFIHSLIPQDFSIWEAIKKILGL